MIRFKIIQDLWVRILENVYMFIMNLFKKVLLNMYNRQGTVLIGRYITWNYYFQIMKFPTLVWVLDSDLGFGFDLGIWVFAVAKSEKRTKQIYDPPSIQCTHWTIFTSLSVFVRWPGYVDKWRHGCTFRFGQQWQRNKITKCTFPITCNSLLKPKLVFGNRSRPQ